MATIGCTNCGAAVNAGAVGCPSCGADPRTGAVLWAAPVSRTSGAAGQGVRLPLVPARVAIVSWVVGCVLVSGSMVALLRLDWDLEAWNLVFGIWIGGLAVSVAAAALLVRQASGALGSAGAVAAWSSIVGSGFITILTVLGLAGEAIGISAFMGLATPWVMMLLMAAMGVVVGTIVLVLCAVRRRFVSDALVGVLLGTETLVCPALLIVNIMLDWPTW